MGKSDASPASPASDSLNSAVKHALVLATQHSRDIAEKDGHWYGSMLSNATITAQWVFLHQCIGRTISKEDHSSYLLHFFSTQQSDGSWPIAPKDPSGGDISTTIEAYLALKILGLATSDKVMRRAREYVVSNGGAERMRMLTRFYLAMFGLLPWAAVPQMPPEIIFLPSWFPVNIYKFSSWARSNIVPLVILRVRQPLYALTNGRHADNNFIDELWCRPDQKRIPYTKSYAKLLFTNPLAWLFQIGDWILWFSWLIGFHPFRRWAIKLCISWIMERQEKAGDWAGIYPPMHLAILILLLEGFGLDDAPVRTALEALDRFCYEDADHGKWMQSSVSPVWDTFLMVRGLYDANTIDETDDSIRRALSWAHRRQIIGSTGDWRVYRPNLIPGGFAFEYFNTWYPDVDDTAAGVLSFLHQDPKSLTSNHIVRASAWILGMQNKDGGWAAFDVDNDAFFLHSIPFSDMDSFCDPSTPDVVGRVLEMFGLMLRLHAKSKCQFGDDLFQNISDACQRGIRYLEETQEIHGGWYGRWGINYICGTCNVLCGFEYFRDQPRVRRMIGPALQWLESVQNDDGGWGEGPDSYIDISKAGIGESTPSQTAWAIMGLLPHMAPSNSSIVMGVGWLVSRQLQHESKDGVIAGTWREEMYTGTGFPGHFYLGYSLYRHYFPMMALGRYVRTVEVSFQGYG